MKLETTFLRSKVARRIFFLFLGCALLPVIAVTLVSYLQVSGQLRQDSRQQLQWTAKTQGMAMYERLEVLDTEVEIATMSARAGHFPDLVNDYGDHFLGATVLPGLAVVPGKKTLAAYSPAEARHLLAGRTLLRVQPCVRGPGSCVALLRLIDTPASRFGFLQFTPGSRHQMASSRGTISRQLMTLPIGACCLGRDLLRTHG
jgi:hypothetical protein